MPFSILHISDLHRDPGDELDNAWLLQSLEQDIEQYGRQEPRITRPVLCIVSGDLVYGVKHDATDAAAELGRQYAQAEEFLVGLADRFFGGHRERVIILPGNHDVSYAEVMGSVQRIDPPNDPHRRAALIAELFAPRSRLRWSWEELCFYRITNDGQYRARLRDFARTYERFYEGRRVFSLIPEQQHGVFDFPEFGLCVVTLNSCFNNDPLHRAGAFNPASVADAVRAIGAPERAGRLVVAAWHHNLFGAPAQTDYLDIGVLQVLIEAGVSLGFHGHQHLTDCVDERHRIGPSPRKITIVSASTLCAGPHNLTPGVPRSYNVVELDTETWTGRVHQRQMVNQLYELPVWGPGHFNSTNRSYVDFEICRPIAQRPVHLDEQLLLERADAFLGSGQWSEAVGLLTEIGDLPLARPLLLRALGELNDPARTVDALWPPRTPGEAVTVGGAICEIGTKEMAAAFVELPCVTGTTDASVREIERRVRQSWL